MSSHALTSKYDSIPEALRAKLIGGDYKIPDFELAEPESLKGYRVALVTTHGPELPEFDIPVNYLRDRGASVEVITQDWLFDYQPEAPGTVVIAQWLAVNVCVQTDKKVSDANIEDYDAVILIGGAWNPIMLRTDESILNFLRSAYSRKLLIASICHGPQVLISAKIFPKGTCATGVDDIRIDLENAGFTVLKEEDVVYDESQRLITSPNPKTASMKAFCEEIGKQASRLVLERNDV